MNKRKKKKKKLNLKVYQNKYQKKAINRGQSQAHNKKNKNMIELCHLYVDDCEFR